MNVKILRFDPDKDTAPYFDQFSVPTTPVWTVMDVLDYITERLDSTVAYYRHSACDHGICARCALKVNGKPTLACTCQVGDGEELILEPRAGQVIRDLVVR